MPGLALHIDYAALSNVLRVTFRDPDGQPVDTRLGFAAMAFDYDDRYRLTRRTFLDAAGKPVATQ